VITVTGTSGSIAATATACVVVGTSTCNSTASTSGKFYILSSSTLAGYSINSGSLNLISNSSFTLNGALAMAIDPTGSYLWVATSGGITPYTINSSTGALTQGSSISAFSDLFVGALQVDPSGKWLIDASKSGYLYAYPITTTGTQDTSRTLPTGIALATTAVAPGGLAISPSGSTNPVIAAAEGTTGTQVFPFTSGNAAPIGSPYSPTIAPYGQSGVAASVAVAFDPSNQFLYIGETVAFPSSASGNSGALRVYKISSGSVKEITYSSGTPTTPYASGGTNPHAILASSNGYVYVANWQGTSNGVVTEFLLSASTPSLTLQSNTVSTGVEPYGMVVDSTGNYVLVVNNQSSPYFNAYTFDATTTGKLDTASVSGSTASNPIAIVAVP
jgi:6-phosphogluconolactonase (cycloisomerase 2 family)